MALEDTVGLRSGGEDLDVQDVEYFRPSVMIDGVGRARGVENARSKLLKEALGLGAARRAVAGHSYGERDVVYGDNDSFRPDSDGLVGHVALV
ncbi:hypothetical protein KBZ00_16980 [Streptomyces sp. RK31]|uniref:hypothetical protein n=1 Tax=Streptomyces sp. RK31 TaxID=2824892 RepID=UPI001B3775C9|nr:hypothetical protein [Streptomyces sp. RK31]MBQ0972820.1 hypothetical protein [Streptomyces sp. RK31]